MILNGFRVLYYCEGYHQFHSFNSMDNVPKIDAPSAAVREFREKEELDSLIKNLHIPTNDDDVRKCLRENDQPVEFLGESKESRRQRLAQFLARKTKRSRDDGDVESQGSDPDTLTEKVIEAYTTKGDDHLLKVRQEITQYVNDIRRSTNTATVENSNEGHNLSLYGSQSGFGRAVSSVKFLPQSGPFPRIATTDWSGWVSIMNLDDDMSLKANIHLFEGGILSGLGVCDDLICVGTGSGGIPVIKTSSDAQLQIIDTLKGHTGRVSQFEFHPSKKVGVSASYDATWKLWDLENMTAVLSQDGHTDAVTNIKINTEGSVAATSSFDKSVRLWDLRSGINILTNDDHIREVHALAWRNSYEYASAGADNTCYVYDLRNTKTEVLKIYAHTGCISDLHFNGDQLISASYDSTIKVWDPSGRKSNEILLGSRIMSIDFDHDNLVAGRWDRSVDWCK